jgi:hypothetical protein
MTCEYDLSCTVKDRITCQRYETCTLRHFRLVQERFAREDAETKRKLFPFHSYQESALIGDFHMSAEQGRDGVNV